MKNNTNMQRIFKLDPTLKNYKDDLKLRVDDYKRTRKELLGNKRKISSVANFHEYYGFTKTRTGWIFRDWAPAADEVILVGDFNDWNTESHKLKRIDENTFEIEIKGIRTIPHNSRLKVLIRKDGQDHYRVPMFINKVRQEVTPEGALDFYGIMHNPPRRYKFKHKLQVEKDFKPFIYETHIGIAQERGAIGSYEEFMDILPRIKDLGYNTIQIMAIASHVYYGSFGYHVTNYFAASHWFGDIENLKKMIDRAHELGIAVIMDIVHSHASKDVNEGINNYDTTDYQLFHSGARGYHELWDSKLFDYGKITTLKFLLSNIKYFMEEYNFDGFRFDGVTSMIYHDHGLGKAFLTYDDYFSMNTEIEALTYLTLANELMKEINPNSISIAEDVSGMPALCLPIKEGGVGFDYRFNMGVTNFWYKTLDLDEKFWDMNWMWFELTAKRPEEKTIVYSESHDQSIVGDKTIMMKLADAELYWNMNIENQSYIIHRAIALHKLITSITMNTASDGYLNFMGNEFGHPEWIDFPSERNNWSYHYARRQWSLVDNEELKYKWLNDFNKDSIHFSFENKLLSEWPKLLFIHNEFKLVMFKRNGLYFVYNFHPTKSYEGLSIPVEEDGQFQVVFSSDDSKYGGLDRISKDYIYESKEIFGTDYDYNISIYSPSRTMMVLKQVKPNKK